MKTLVLGIGNLLLADEGVGVHAARALATFPLPEGVRVLEVGTALLDAIPALEEAERLIVIDAVEAGQPPGSVYRIPLDRLEPARVIGGMHGFDLSRTLAFAGRSSPPEAVVIGVEPAVIGWSVDLSPAVAESLPHVVEAVLEEVLRG